MVLIDPEKIKEVGQSVKNFFRTISLMGLVSAMVVFGYSYVDTNAPSERVGGAAEKGENEPQRRTVLKPVLDSRGATGTPMRTISVESPTEEEAQTTDADASSAQSSSETGLPSEGDSFESSTNPEVAEVDMTPDAAPDAASDEMPMAPPEDFASGSGVVATPEIIPESTLESIPTSETTMSPMVSSPTRGATSATEADAPPSVAPLASHVQPAYAPNGCPSDVVVVEQMPTPPLKSPGGPPVSNFLEIFDFSIDPDWVLARWTQVSNVGPLSTRGYRVPLSTGPDKTDLVGSLTYYFNARLEVEKITFEGYTGDISRLVITLRRFDMSKKITSDPNIELYESPTHSGNQRSYMKTYHRLTPLSPDNPYKQFWITMELYPPEV
ncbi:MAG: hypothetical protein Q4D38_11415 [Planctomycetia bacterium]|nr:hypothetical protein [Planctomycetia bacterium]